MIIYIFWIKQSKRKKIGQKGSKETKKTLFSHSTTYTSSGQVTYSSKFKMFNSLLKSIVHYLLSVHHFTSTVNVLNSPNLVLILSPINETLLKASVAQRKWKPWRCFIVLIIKTLQSYMLYMYILVLTLKSADDKMHSTC